VQSFEIYNNGGFRFALPTLQISISIEDLQKALLRGGSPMTAIEMQKRFINYMNSLTKGKELSQVRAVLE